MDKKSSVTSKYETKLREETCLLSSLDILYQNEYSGPYEDISHYGDDCIVIAALKGEKITGFGRPVIAVGESKPLKEQFQRLYNISHDILYIDYLEGGLVSAASKFLLQKGLAARPYFTQIIDLTKTEEELYSDLRKSYKQLARQGEPYRGNLSLYDFRKLHIAVCGYETRTIKTWDIQYEMMKNHEAFLICEKFGDIRSGSFFMYNDYVCYYGVSASLPQVNTHPVIWRAIQTARNLGCKTLEMGEQIFSGNEKLVNISKFKAGFGGQCVMRLLIGEKDE